MKEFLFKEILSVEVIRKFFFDVLKQEWLNTELLKYFLTNNNEVKWAF